VEQAGYLPQLLAVVAVGVVAALLLARFKLPAIAGFLLAGALAGPHGFALINDAEGILHIAEFGVVLLLFTLGVEFSGERLRRLGRIVLTGGVLQTIFTIAAAVGIALAFGKPLNVAFFYGFVFVLSSTAIVLKLYQQMGQLDAPHGRFVVGTLLFQDIIVVLFMLLTPLLAGADSENALLELGTILAKAVVLVGFAFFASKYLIGPLLNLVDGTPSRELFVLTTLTICLGTALLSGFAGISLALGAFLAGVVMASSGFGHRALGEILPLRDVLASVFFITLGMLFDWRVMVEHPLQVAFLFAAFILGKGLLASLAALLSGYPARVGWLAGVGLAQFGEFGFVLITEGQAARLLTSDESSALLAAGILSMMATAILIRVAPKLRWMERMLRPLERYHPGSIESHPHNAPAKDHIIIAGYGPGGRLLSRVLSAVNAPHVIYDLNSEAILSGKASGEPIVYGDITHPETLEHAHARDAKAIVVMFNDPQALPRAIDTLQRHAPNVPILARCRYMAESRELLDMGAELVVVEEVETGFTMLRRLLERLGHGEERVRAEMANLREELAMNTESHSG
jgi:CPA2 family monovalent cation:H+ antiporter-2